MRTMFTFLLERRLIVLAIVLILLFAFLLRSYVYLHGDFLYLIDQARDLLLVKEIAVNHDIPLIGARSGMGGIFHGPLWLFILVPTFLLSGGDPFFTLVPIFLFVSLLTILVGIIGASKLYGERYGLVFGLFLTISAVSLGSMANFSNAHVMPLFFLLYLVSILLYMRGKESMLIACSLFIGLGIHFEAAFAIFLFPITLVAMALSKRFPTIRTLTISAIVFIVSISNYVLFEVKNHFLMSNSAGKLLSGSVEPLKGFEQYSDFGFRLNDRVMGFLGSFNAPMYSETLYGKVAIIGLILVVCFIIFSKSKHKDLVKYYREFLFLLTIPTLIFSLLVLYPQPVWVHYTLPLFVSSILTFVLGLKILSLRFTQGKILTIFIVILLVAPAVYAVGTRYSKSDNTWRSVGSLYKPQLEVAQWVFSDAKAQKFGFLVYSPQILTYQMDYLMWYVGTKNSTTSYINNKDDVTYLVLSEPKEGDTDAQLFWKKNVLHTKGKIVKKQAFNNGMSVEKTVITKDEPAVDPNYFHGLLFR